MVSYAVAVRAHDVALGRFSLENPLRLEHGATGGQTERFRRRIPMVEVQLVGREPAAAVDTRRTA
jgi:hypothetical protein